MAGQYYEFVQRPDASRLILKRRKDAQLIEFVKVLNPTVRTLKLLAGEIHLLQNDLPPELVTYLAENPSISFQHKQGSKFAYIGFNHQDPVVGQNLVRKAIAHAINREQIIQYALGGRAQLAQALFPPSHWVGASPSLFFGTPIRSDTSGKTMDDPHISNNLPLSQIGIAFFHHHLILVEQREVFDLL